MYKPSQHSSGDTITVIHCASAPLIILLDGFHFAALLTNSLCTTASLAISLYTAAICYLTLHLCFNRYLTLIFCFALYFSLHRCFTRCFTLQRLFARYLTLHRSHSRRGPARGGGAPGGGNDEATQDVDAESRAPPPTLLSSFGEGARPACCPGGRPHNTSKTAIELHFVCRI